MHPASITVFLIGFFCAASLLSVFSYWRLRQHKKQAAQTLETQHNLAQSKEEHLEKNLADAHLQLQVRDQQVQDFQRQLTEEVSRSATLEERTKRLPSLEQALQDKDVDLKRFLSDNARLSTEITQQKQAFGEKLHVLETARQALSENFKALSAEALSANNKSFLTLANATFEKLQKGSQMSLDQRQQSIDHMLKPVSEALGKVDIKINELEKSRTGAYQALRQQVQDLALGQKDLRNETANLVKALRKPTVRGQWGEMQLKRVVEIAGMLEHCDFSVQKTATTDEGDRRRPDMIINLPGGKKIIVDAKAPLSAYLDALDAEDEPLRQKKLKEHAQQVRAHIRALSQRTYWEQFRPSPEFVVLFLPGEPFFSAALEKDPSLIEAGVQERVILATPTTLIALLRAVSYGWRQESVAENARVISDLGRTLYKRLKDMGGHLGKMGRTLHQTVEAYNSTVGTLERRVMVSARKFQTLEATASTQPLEKLTAVETHPRQVQEHAEDTPMEEATEKDAAA